MSKSEMSERIIVERTGNPVYVCAADGSIRLDDVEYRARAGRTEIACFWVKQADARYVDQLLPVWGQTIGSIFHYLPMQAPR